MCGGLRMELTAWIVGVTVFNIIAAAAIVIGMYSMMERHVVFGAVGGIGLGAAVIYVQATLGEQWFTITVGEMKLLVIAAAVGAAIGVTATILTVEPELS